MPRPDFHDLRTSLLKGGMPIWRVRRTLAELRDHREDLAEEARAAGLSRLEAEFDAASRLGDETLLAQEILRRPELTSCWWRWSRVGAMTAAIAGSHGSTGWLEGSGDDAMRWAIAACSAALVTASLLFLLQFCILAG